MILSFIQPLIVTLNSWKAVGFLNPAARASFYRPIHLTILCFLILLSVSVRSEETSPEIQVRVAVNNAPPYRIIDDSQVGGLYIDIFNALADRLRWHVIYEEVPFPRALHMMEFGQADIMLGPIRRPEREAFMDYSIPAFPPERKLFLVKSQEQLIHSYQDLKDKNIGTLRGSVYFIRFDRDKSLTKIEGSNYRNLLRMLEFGRLDTVIIPELLAVALQKEMGLQFLASPYTIPGETSYITLSRKSLLKEHVREIKEALDQLKSDQTYSRLVDKYR
ncbi:substrate-binding periplasmic protein [Hahella ganghwensis]|uniref:substrate-binding periplasmic protein n=1 Tax=Hahella ganghwensis TaxID=286420 RepID=UPI00036DAF52|nr:transporter substrate-binding domain-containing protein [Hahella ganghwensis]